MLRTRGFVRVSDKYDPNRRRSLRSVVRIIIESCYITGGTACRLYDPVSISTRDALGHVSRLVLESYKVEYTYKCINVPCLHLNNEPL